METDPINQSWDTSETNTGIITTRTVNNIITKSKIQRKLEVDMANKKSNGEPSPEPKINHQENEISKIYVQMFAKQFNKILINKNKDDRIDQRDKNDKPQSNLVPRVDTKVNLESTLDEKDKIYFGFHLWVKTNIARIIYPYKGRYERKYKDDITIQQKTMTTLYPHDKSCDHSEMGGEV